MELASWKRRAQYIYLLPVLLCPVGSEVQVCGSVRVREGFNVASTVGFRTLHQPLRALELKQGSELLLRSSSEQKNLPISFVTGLTKRRDEVPIAHRHSLAIVPSEPSSQN